MTDVTKLIDRAIGDLIRAKGKYTYEDVETHISKALGRKLKPTLVGLGKQKLRDRILTRSRDISRKLLDKSLSIHPSLFSDDLAPIYPCKAGGETTFKPLVKMTQLEIARAVDVLEKDQTGLGRHLSALRHIQAGLNGVWKTSPDYTVEQAQVCLTAEAAE